MRDFIRLVPDEQPTLSPDDSRDAATAAYTRARAAQRALVSNLGLTDLMYRAGKVTHARLKGELHEARRQVERAQAVADELAASIEAIHAGARGLGWKDAP